MMHRLAIGVGVAIWLTAWALPALAAPIDLSVDEVLADAAAYEGKQVRVHGFVTFEFENNRIWRDEAAFRAYQPEHALYLSAWDLSQSSRDAAKGRLAYVSGTFVPDEHHPHLNNLVSVERDPNDLGPDRGWWSDPAEFTTLLAVLGAFACASFTLLWGSRARRSSASYGAGSRMLGSPIRRQRSLKRR